MITFAEQSERYMTGLRQSRKQRRPRTLQAYQSYLNMHLVPQIGQRPLKDLDNAAAKEFFGRIADGLSASTINGIFNVLKGVVASAVDQNGNQTYPMVWNKSFLDLPRLSPAEQNTPEIGRELLRSAISAGSPEDRLLWVLLAGSGLRVGEALAVTTTPDGSGNFWDWENKTIDVRVQRHEDGQIGPPKTAAGRRVVDLCQTANNFLLNVWTNSSKPLGFMFRTGERALRDRLNDAAPNTGFHAFRRFRLTQLAVTNVPAELEYFWTGHAAKDVHGRYMKWGSRLEERRDWAERVGLGFELPAVSS
jgi:integrase